MRIFYFNQLIFGNKYACFIPCYSGLTGFYTTGGLSKVGGGDNTDK